jgi:hypothetical protein
MTVAELEDAYVSGEFAWNSKKQNIIRAWADRLSYSSGLPDSTICQHIKQRLRLRGVSEGSIAYVHDCLTGDYAKYKDPKFDTSDADRRGFPRPAIFEDFEDLAKETLSPEQLEERSTAEQYEIITKEIKLIKSVKTKMSDRVELLEDFAKSHDVRIPDFEKESSDLPPPQFWGHSKWYVTLEALENEVNKLAKSLADIKKTAFYFRPDPQVAEYCSKKMQEYDKALTNLVNAIMVVIKGMQNVMNPVSDGKWGALLDGWLKIGWDQKVNCGSHGSGVTNSIDTGEYVIKEYRDGRTEVVGLKREFTREQVGDKTQRDLLKLAMVAVKKDQAQQALSYWIANTNLVEMVNEE